MTFYYEQAEDGEVVGIVPFDSAPIEDNGVFSPHSKTNNSPDYNLMTEAGGASLGEGLSIIGLVMVLMLGGSLISIVLLPTLIIGVLYYMIRKYV